MVFKTFKLPDLGEGIADARVDSIKFKTGAAVSEDQVLCVVETDKAAVEIPSPFNGMITRWNVKVGATVNVGDDLVSFLTPKLTYDLKDPTAIAIRNLRILNVETLCREPFLEFSALFHDVRSYAEQFRGIKLSRLADAHRQRLLQLLYAIWHPIVKIREEFKSGHTPDANNLQRIAHGLRDDYRVSTGEFSELLDEAKLAMRPNVFIGSSTDALGLAYEVQKQLSPQIVCSVWKQDPVFMLNQSTLDALMGAIDRYDFGVFIFSADDEKPSKGDQLLAPRDNVVFEYGLFLGRLGRRRAFILRDVHSQILTDLQGITTARFDGKKVGKVGSANRYVELGSPCTRIRDAIEQAWFWPVSEHE